MIILYGIKRLIGIVFGVFMIPLITVFLMPLMLLWQVTKWPSFAFCVDRLLDLSEWTAENCLMIDRRDKE